jgi:hypothetical protein
MLNAKVSLASALLAMAFVGCASEPPPPDDTGTEVPLAQAPEFDVPDDIKGYPDFYRRARCVIVAPPGKLSDEEFENFVDAFTAEFFGVCFQAIDTDVVNKARERSSAFAGVPPTDRLTQMANESKADFTLYIDLSMKNQAIDASDNVQRRDIAGKSRARATAKLVGGQAKDSKELSATIKLDQIFSSPRKQELRGQLATILGKSTARKLLSEAAGATGASAEIVVNVILKAFDKEEKKTITEELFGLKGVDPDASSQRNVGGVHTVIINTTRNMNQLRRDIEYMLEDNDFTDARVQQSSAVELIIKAR